MLWLGGITGTRGGITPIEGTGCRPRRVQRSVLACGAVTSITGMACTVATDFITGIMCGTTSGGTTTSSTSGICDTGVI